MPRIAYQPKDFKPHMGGRFLRASTVDFTWGEFVKAAITVGKPSWGEVFRFGDYSVSEALWRTGLLWANLVQGGDGALRPSRAFLQLDPSEKGAISYFLGMAVAKLLVEKLLSVPWLLHVDVYRAILEPSLAFKKRPDLVGLDAFGNFVVVESKGHSWGMPAATMRQAKEQTRSLRRVGGAYPALRVAIGSSFAKSRWMSDGALGAVVWDPEGHDEDASDLEIETERFFRAYYGPLVTGIHDHGRGGGRGEHEIALGNLDASVALAPWLIDWYSSDRLFEEARPKEGWGFDVLGAARLASVNSEAKSGGLTLLEALLMRRDTNDGRDGISVRLGPAWDASNMQREPTDRERRERR